MVTDSVCKNRKYLLFLRKYSTHSSLTSEEAGGREREPALAQLLARRMTMRGADQFASPEDDDERS